MSRKINEQGLEIIKKFEGLRLQAYPDPGTGGDPWTLGYGHTKGVHKGDMISKDRAEDLLKEDLRDAQSGVDAYLIAEISDNQFSALVSFAFNVGVGNYRTSTLLKLINQEKFEEAAEQFIRWNKASGHELPGLTARRLAEKALFLS